MVKKVLGVFVLFGLMAGAALADQGNAASAGSIPPINLGGGYWSGIINGFVAGIVAVFYGYAKNRDPKSGEMESFDIRYAFPTLIVGGLIGVIAAFMKVTPQDLGTALSTSPVYGAVVFAAEALLKAVFRHSVPWIRDAIDKLKAAPKETPTESPEDKPPTQ